MLYSIPVAWMRARMPRAPSPRLTWSVIVPRLMLDLDSRVEVSERGPESDAGRTIISKRIKNTHFRSRGQPSMTDWSRLVVWYIGGGTHITGGFAGRCRHEGPTNIMPLSASSLSCAKEMLSINISREGALVKWRFYT